MNRQPQGAIRAGLRAARRERRGVGAAVLGRALLVGASVSLVLVGLDRALALSLNWAALVGGPIVVSGLAALVWTALRPVRAMHGAALIDRAHNTHDRVRNAIALGDDPASEDDAFTRLAIEQGEAVAREADVARATPVRIGWPWLAWPLVGALAVLGAMLLPARTLSPGEGASPTATLAEREEAGEQVEQALQAMRRAALDEPSLEGASVEALDRLEELESELRDGSVTPEEARAEAADTLEQAADRLEREAEQRELEREAFEALARELETSDDAMSRELAERLRSGDFEQASEAARELLERGESMSPEQREALAQELESLSRQLDEAAGFDESTPPGSADPGAEAPEGSDPGAPDAPSPEPEPVPEPDAGAPLAPPTPAQEELERQQEAQDRARDEARRVSDALRRSAERVREDQSPSDPGAQRPEQGEQSPQDPSRREPGKEQGEQRQGEQRQGEQGQGEQGQGEQGKTDQAQPSQGERGQGEDGTREQSGEAPEASDQTSDQAGEQTENRSGQQPADRTGEQSGASEEGAGEDEPGRRPEGEPAGQEPSRGQGAPEDGAPEPGAGASEERRPGQGQGQTPDQGGGEPGEQESLDQQLRRMGERSGEGERQLEKSQELRRQARRMMGEGEEPGSGPKAGDRGPTDVAQAPAPIEGARTTPVDARRTPEDPTGEQVIGDWYSDEALQRDPAARREAGERIRQARAGAERAIEQQRVPRARRDLVRRVYERYAESAEGGGEGLSPAGQDAGGDAP